MHFQGQERFHAPWPRVVGLLGNAGFLADCVPDSTIQTATADRAIWQVPPPLRVLSEPIQTTLTITHRSGEQIDFTIENQTRGASALAQGQFQFTEPSVIWSVELTRVGGLLKMVPPSVVRTQVAALVPELWQRVQMKLAPVDEAFRQPG